MNTYSSTCQSCGEHCPVSEDTLYMCNNCYRAFQREIREISSKSDSKNDYSTPALWLAINCFIVIVAFGIGLVFPEYIFLVLIGVFIAFVLNTIIVGNLLPEDDGKGE